jgi:DNA mismatch repair ATPase MutS
MLTTHYVDLCKKLIKTNKSNISNKHMKVIVKDDKFEYKYKLINKISEIKGGINVLKQLNYPTKIIESTRLMINN